MPVNDDRFAHLRKEVLGSVKKFRHIDLDMLQVEIISRLLEGRRTATELVIEIYEIEPGQPEYPARYASVRRSLKDLENRGYASTNLLGRDKPYRLSNYGIAILCSIIPENDELPRIVGKKEFALLGLTGMTAIMLILLRNSGEIVVFTSFAAFFTLFGLSLRTFLVIMGRVI